MVSRWFSTLSLVLCLFATAVASEATAAEATPSQGEAELCVSAGPQAPRDVSNRTGENPVAFPLAPRASELRLCNIHTHTHAEHRGPGFFVAVDEKPGGYACNGAGALSEEELAPAPGAYGNVEPGNTIEVHWVHTSCAAASPGQGLGACVPEGCSDPLLRVESQVFLVVNDRNALDFMDMIHGGHTVDGRPQAKRIPSDTGQPILYRGSTTGPKYTQSQCSPVQVTWSVRPQCAKLDIHSLHAWAAEGNVFGETASHGVRRLVTAPELLAPISTVAER